MNIYTQNDNKVLKYILDENCCENGKGLARDSGTSVKELVQTTGLSDKKVRSSIKKFIEDELVDYGVSDGNTRKYIVTPKGLDYIKSLSYISVQEEY